MPVTVIPNTSANNPVAVERLRFIGQTIFSHIYTIPDTPRCQKNNLPLLLSHSCY